MDSNKSTQYSETEIKKDGENVFFHTTLAEIKEREQIYKEYKELLERFNIKRSSIQRADYLLNQTEK